MEGRRERHTERKKEGERDDWKIRTATEHIHKMIPHIIDITMS